MIAGTSTKFYISKLTQRFYPEHTPRHTQRHRREIMKPTGHVQKTGTCRNSSPTQTEAARQERMSLGLLVPDSGVSVHWPKLVVEAEVHPGRGLVVPPHPHLDLNDHQVPDRMASKTHLPNTKEIANLKHTKHS